MEMTEVQKLAKIKVLEDLYKEYELLAKYNGGRDYDRYCALELAINTMRKYQKICKILDRSDDGEQCMYDTIQEIEEVRDGNVD